jgi:hypothetical protein
MSNTKKAKQPSLRDLARNAKPRLEHYFIPVIDYDDAMAVWTRLNEAKASLRSTRAFADDVLASAQAEVDKVQAEFDECFRKVSFRGLSANDLDALSNEHPEPVEGEEPDEGHVAFLYHLAAASCINGEDMTAEDWQDLCDNVWSGAESAAFRNAVMNANSREFTHGIPKG